MAQVDMQRYSTDPVYRNAIDSIMASKNRAGATTTGAPGDQVTPGPASPGPLPGVPVAGPSTNVTSAGTPNHPAILADDAPLSARSDFDTSPSSGLLFQLRPYLDALGDPEVDAKAGFRAGRELGREFFDFGTLGRLGTSAAGVEADSSLVDPSWYLNAVRGMAARAGGRSNEVQELIRRRMANLGGLTAEENQALLDRGESQLNSALRTGLRGVRARTPGIVGGAGAIASNPVIERFAQGHSDLARDLTIANIEAKEKALTGASDLIRGVEKDEFSQSFDATKALGEGVSTFRDDLARRSIFDLQQLAKEKAGQLGLLFGAGQFGAAQAANREAQDISREAVNNASNTSIPSIELPDFGSIFGSIFEGLGGLFGEEEEPVVVTGGGPVKPSSLPKK